MLRYDEESQLLDEDVPRIAHNAGALVLMLLCTAVMFISAVALLTYLS